MILVTEDALGLALLKEKLDSFSQPMALLQELQKGLSAIGSGGGSAIVSSGEGLVLS